MNKLFPAMSSKPEKIHIFSIIPCWLWVFVLIPMFMPFIGFGLWEQWEKSVWLEIGYHAVNGIAMFLLMQSYFKEEWFMVTTDVWYYLRHVALTVALITGAELVFFGISYFCGFDIVSLFECLPAVEMTVSHTSLFTVVLEPIFGTLAMSLFAPISICVLFYCFAFASVCYKKPWLAYTLIVVITLIPSVVDILWRGDAVFVLSCYFVRLPIHLLACWSYQKTDNVWTPVAALSLTNLTASVVAICLNHYGVI